jgi:hypothetical protein
MTHLGQRLEAETAWRPGGSCAGGFLQVTKHDVAVPVSWLKLVEGKLVLPGATRDALKASHEFE